MMKKTIVISAAIAVFITAGNAQARQRPSCDTEIKTVSDMLSAKGAGKIRDMKWAASTVRTIRKAGRLPEEYVRIKVAKKFGWPDSNKWRMFRDSRKTRTMFGGDPYSSDVLFGKGSFYTADLDAKGIDQRGPKRMVYDPIGGKIFVTTDKYRIFVEVQNCF